MLSQCPRLCSFPPFLNTLTPHHRALLWNHAFVRRASVAVITPPLIKTNGPSLGIAMLNGALSKAGHTCYSLDLNIHQPFLEYAPIQNSDPRPKNPIRGDHDKDTSRWDIISKEFHNAHLEAFANLPHIYGHREEAEQHMWFDWLCLKEASHRLLNTQYGVKMGEKLKEFVVSLSDRPVLVGVSVMFSSQIIVSMSISLLLRDLLPGVQIVWGGPHISALRDEIFRDTSAYSHGFGADLFVSGYAEKTFVTLANWLAQSVHTSASSGTAAFRHAKGSLGNHPIPFLVGCGDPYVRPIFPQNLDPYCSKGARLTMPMQLRRGCAYGQCSFCTYPHVEGKPIGSAEQTTKILNQSGVIQIVQTLLGMGIETTVSFKDALMPRGDLLAVSEHLSQQNLPVEWSACTKLTDGLERILKQLYVGGCRTLELGIETLDPVTASIINKPQSEIALIKLLDSAAQVRLPLVLNYITGFPGEGPDARKAFERLKEEVFRKNVCMGLIAKIEHNTFQLERLSAMGRNPEKYGIFIPVDRAKIPAATVLPHCEVP